jgi:two-component system, chemotaxis family, CheB/CheR fusion protein
LIEDMLDISRITSGKLRLNTQPLDLVSVVNLAIESVQHAAEAKSIQLALELNSVTIVGDIDRLQQVLWNLLSNAINFTPTGGRIEIMLAPVQTQAEIRISDTGQGISAAFLPYVFDRFRQGDSSTTKSKQGLGLGLTIVRNLIELHGGTVQAESPGEGQGTTLTVRLPLQSMPLEFIPPSDLEPTAEEPSVLVNPQASALEGLQFWQLMTKRIALT